MFILPLSPSTKDPHWIKSRLQDVALAYTLARTTASAQDCGGIGVATRRPGEGWSSVVIGKGDLVSTATSVAMLDSQHEVIKTSHKKVLRGCPPADASPGPRYCFRAVRQVPPGADDFQTAEEAGRLLDRDPCLRRALSVFDARKDAERLIASVPYFRKHKPVGGYVPTGAGVFKRTPSQAAPSHVSWWPSSTDRHSYFQEEE